MKFEQLAHTIANEEREMLEQYLKYGVVNILEEEPEWADVIYELPDDVKRNYVKPKMFPCETYRVETTDMNMVYVVSIRTAYTDTVAIDGNSDFAKVETALKFDAEISPESRVAEAAVMGSIDRKL